MKKSAHAHRFGRAPGGTTAPSRSPTEHPEAPFKVGQRLVEMHDIFVHQQRDDDGAFVGLPLKEGQNMRPEIIRPKLGE